jgi:endonuclease YncB( thermonuclease family)
MPVRMLSVDTPEVTARTDRRATEIDAEFAQLAEWMLDGTAPISRPLAEALAPKLATGKAGSLQLRLGREASAFAQVNTDARLTRPDGTRRNLFLRTADAPFDTAHRMLAYVAPSFSAAELESLSRLERSTFNLDLVRAGWAATFVLYPSVPGERDLPLLVSAAAAARLGGLGMWAEPDVLLAYEYRAMEKLHAITRRIAEGADLPGSERFAWRERYCVDLRSRVLHGPEDYVGIPPEYRLWLWRADVPDAISRLNLVPAPALVAP